MLPPACLHLQPPGLMALLQVPLRVPVGPGVACRRRGGWRARRRCLLCWWRAAWGWWRLMWLWMLLTQLRRLRAGWRSPHCHWLWRV